MVGTIVVLVGSTLTGCGGGSSGSGDTTTTTAPYELQYAAHADPAVPISVEAGRRFAVILPADPGSGWRWVLGPVDAAIVLPLGSEFRDDADLLARTKSAVTTTTSAPTPTTARPSGSSTTTASTSTSIAASTPLVQILSFAGRSPATTTLTFRYERIGAPPDAAPIVVTFTVTVTPLTGSTTR